MTILSLDFHNYKYFPYERRLAELEVRRLLGVEPSEANGSLRVQVPNGVRTDTLKRFTYFQKITATDGTTVVPQQACLEASATRHGDPGRLRRQSTRYSAHGLHEYRGKFNPQIARAIMNLVGLEVGDRIWDLFCGSGTVLLESRHQGLNALGVDMNPLAVAITNAKLAAVRSRPKTLKAVATVLAERVQARWALLDRQQCSDDALQDCLGSKWLESHRCSDYLKRWFPTPVLAQFTVILDSINEITYPAIRNVFRMILSDILRDVSWQDPGDLRVRRRKDPSINYPATEAFIAALEARVEAVAAAREHFCPNQGWQRAFEADSGNIESLPTNAREFLEGGIDCVISSPPYATALPYIDTQRLSLALFDFATVGEIRRLDRSLVGSRELLTRDRRTLEKSIDENQDKLPDDVWKLCQDLRAAYAPETDGFRRHNTPAVVYRYFSGMARAMAVAKKYLRCGGHLAFIVGPNRTSLGGKEFFIDTPALLATIGEQVGLQRGEIHELNAYSRYNIHSHNSIREERLLFMRRP